MLDAQKTWRPKHRNHDQVDKNMEKQIVKYQDQAKFDKNFHMSCDDGSKF